MKRTKILKIRIFDEEKKQIIALAKELKRSQSDAIRFVVSEYVNAMKLKKME